MPPSGTNSQAEAAPTLPLFRPEAMAAQERLHGEVLLIRPLSLAFLIWLAIGLGVALLAFLVFGRTTETAQIPTVLISPSAAGSPAKAGLDVPSSYAPFVHPGTSLVIRCPGCSDPGQKLNGKVISIEKPAAPGSLSHAIVALPPEFASLTGGQDSGEVALEAEVPVGRTSLIHWLLKPSPR